MVLSLFKGMGNSIFQVQAVKSLLLELMDRRQKYHVGTDSLHQNLSPDEIETLCLLLEVKIFANLVYLFRNDSAEVRNATKAALLTVNIAVENGYSKLILGSCSSAIACHVISATVKGQGYSLPADVQYVDTRWEVPVVLPLRDCIAQELSLLCHLDNLKTQQLLDRPSAGINGLVSSFVTRLREENPSRERTIVRTAEKLKPFCFNKFSANGYHDFLPSRLRPKFQNVDDSDSVLSEVLCPICGSPLSEIELHNMRSAEGEAKTSAQFFARCCQSCCFQILPNGAAAYEKFFSLLPQSMIGSVKDSMFANRSRLREEIKDYLLDDQDDDS